MPREHSGGPLVVVPSTDGKERTADRAALRGQDDAVRGPLIVRLRGPPIRAGARIALLDDEPGIGGDIALFLQVHAKLVLASVALMHALLEHLMEQALDLF